MGTSGGPVSLNQFLSVLLLTIAFFCPVETLLLDPFNLHNPRIVNRDLHGSELQ